MKRLESSLRNFIADRDFFRLILKYSLPVALQYLVMSSLNMIATMLIGQLGEISVAAVGLTNQVWFMLNLVIFGVVSGAAMFIAQLWGKRDIANIRRVLGLTLKLCLLTAAFFWFVATFYPASLLRIYTEDPEVIQLGSRFLRIFSWSYGFFAITAAFGAACRSTGNVRLPLVVSTSALGLNILLAYSLIFGIKVINIPALGIEGAAIAGLIARSLECITMIFIIYRDRSGPFAASIHDIIALDPKFLTSVIKPILPVIVNEVLWSLGITTYTVIYGHIGTEAVAAINIVSTVDQMAFALFMGLGTATSILVGNLIGKGQREKAYAYAGRSLLLQMSGAMLMGLIVYLFAGHLFQFYQVSPDVILDARSILNVMAMGMWIRASNQVIIFGILRSGGDTRFSLILDGLLIWFVGVPLTAMGAFLFDLPVHLVYALTLSEEAAKLILGVSRYLSKKWINDLTTRVVE